MPEAPNESPISPTYKELPSTPEVTIRHLDKENPEDFAIARTLDLVSLGAINPFSHELENEEALHDAMTDE